jgi:hypothetical protein
MTKHLALFAISVLASLISFAQPVIQSFLPASGPVNTSVTITGTGFSTVAADNIVFFGATKATVTASTATTITATVPAGASYHPITVTTGNLTAYSALPFVVATNGSGAGVPLTSTSFVPAQNFTTGYYPHGLALGDFNLDGKTDLVVSKGSSSTVSVLTNTTTGITASFATPLELALPGTSHEEAATGDLDGDGKLDFVVTNTFGNNSISAFRNTTTGSTVSFAAKIDLAVVGSPYGVAIGDVDGDGKPDIVAVNSTTGANVVSVLRNISTPGNLSFASKVDLPGGVGPFSISITDLDADGKAEIIVTGQYASSSHLSVLKNNSTIGNISFQTPLELANLSAPFNVAVGDLNGDSKPDIVAAVAGANAVLVKRNTSTPGVLGFSGTTDYFSTGTYPRGVAIADIDGDGRPDVVAANNQGNTVSVLQNASTSGSISFAGHIDYAVGAYPSIVTCGDLDGDGRADIIAANTSATYVSVLKNIIAANVAPAISSFTPASGVNGTTVTITGTNFSGATAVKFGGVNASSFTINSNTSITAIVGPGASGEVSVATSFGTAVLAGFVFNGAIINSFTPATGVAGTVVNITGTNFTGATAVKFGGVNAASFTVNSSTNITAVVANGASGDVTVTTANGTATRAGFSFGAPSITWFTPFYAPAGATVTIGGTNFSATVADNTVFFGSVKATVLSATTEQLTVTVPAGAIYAPISVTTNRLTGYSSKPFYVTFPTVNPQLTTSSFINAGNYGTGAYPSAVYSCDLNDDGKPELITANAIGNTISILKNLSSRGNVSFAGKVDYATANDPKYIAFGDLDGDGKPDLVVVNFNRGSASVISVFRNTSTGGNISVAPKIEIATGNGSLGIGVADINGDGKPDIVVTSGNSGFISILQNTTVGSTITFAPKQDYTLLTHPDDLVLADLDNDGRTDIVTSNWSDANISIYRNTSTGGILSVASRVDFSVGTYPGRVVAADIDNDARLDLVIKTNGAVTVLKNLSTYGSGSILMGGLLNFTLPARNVNVGDLNGDGKPDICAGQTGSGKISIYENKTTFSNPISMGANVDFTTASFDTYATIGDLDGDGKPEIAAANTTTYAVTILQNNVDGPTVTQISPATARKGDVVTITGLNLEFASDVRFGGAAAGSFTRVSSTRIDAVVGGGASGTVTVTAPYGTGGVTGFSFIPEVRANGPVSFCNNGSVTLSSTADAGNQWYRNGVAVNGATAATYQAITSGVYTVRTTNNNITTSSPAGITVSVITVPTPTITKNGTVLTSSAATGNQWYLNGVLIANATAQTYEPTEGGVYKVQVMANDCASALSEGYTYTLSGAIDLGGNQYVKLSQNPVRSVLSLQWSIDNTRTLSVEIRDMYGKLVLFNKSVSSGEPINISALNTGTYFVKLYGEDQKPVASLKILKIN